MGGFTFLVMLAGFGYVVYWYLTNLLKGQDGSFGILGLKDNETSSPTKKSKKKSKLAYFRNNPDDQNELKQTPHYDHNQTENEKLKD